MAGLEYIIDASYAGQDRVQAFRDDIEALRRELSAIKKDAKGLGQVSQALKASKTRNRSTKRAADDQRRVSEAAREAAAATEAQAAAARKAAFEASRMDKNIRRATEDSKEAARVARELEAAMGRVQRNAERSATSARVLAARVEQARKAAAGTTGLAGIGRMFDPVANQDIFQPFRDFRNLLGEVPGRARAAWQELTRVNTEGTRLGNTGRSAIGPWTRLFRVMLAYAGARAIFHGITRALRESIRFAASFEDSILGTASVITSLGRVFNADGPLQGMEALVGATKIAKEQMEQLLVEGLRTSATFQQLADTFQVAVGPGLQSGLDLDFLRTFSVRISQAAQSIGLSQDQLNEEIRSILQGTISQRFTRIATVLNISNEDIKRAKQMGELQEFLTEKFDAFRFSGEAALGNFNQLIANLIDGLQIVGAKGTAGLFGALKTAAAELRNSLAIETANGIFITPEAVRIVENLTEALRVAVEEAGNIGTAVGFDGFLAITEIVRDLSVLLTRSVGTALRFIATGTANIAGVFRPILTIVRAINKALGGLPTKLLELLAGALLVNRSFAAVRATLVFLAPLFERLVGAAKVLGGAKLAGLVTGLSTALLKTVQLVVVFTALGLAFDEIINLVPNLGGKIDRVIVKTAAWLGFVKESAVAAAEAEGAFDSVGEARIFQEGLTSLLSKTQNVLAGLLGSTKDLLAAEEGQALALGVSSDLLKEQLKTVEEINKEAAVARLPSTFRGPGAEAFQEAVRGIEEFKAATQQADIQLDNLKATLRELSKDQISAIVSKDLKRNEELQAQINARLDERDALIQQRQALEEQTTKILSAQLEAIVAQTQERNRLAVSEARIQESLQRSLQAIGQSGADQRLRDNAQLASQIQSQVAAAADLRRQLQQINNNMRQFEERTLAIGAGSSMLPQLARVNASEQERVSAELDAQVAAINTLLQQQARLEAIQSNAAFAFIAGVQDAQQTSGEIFSRVGTNFASTLQQGIEQGAAAALTGDISSQAIDQWATLAGQQLKAQLLAAIIEAFLVKPVIDFAASLLSPDPAADAAQLVATNANTSALSAVTVAAYSMELGLNILGSHITANSGFLSTNTAALIALTKAVLADTVTPGTALGGFMGFAEGGGKVPSAPALKKAPPGLDHRDKIPGMFRRGEYVSTPEMDRRNPGLFGFLEYLRRGGRVARGVMATLPNFNTPRQELIRMPAVMGFAEGGGTAPLSSAPSASGSGGASSAAVQLTPVVLMDSPEFRRAVASATSDIARELLENGDLLRR